MWDGTYETSGYHRFKVFIPKEREIHSPVFRDKVTQHMINNVLRDIYERKFIFDSYACIRGKGNHAAVKRLYSFSKGARFTYNEPTVVKIDISKFFYSIDRELLIELLFHDLGAHNHELLNLLATIIASSPLNDTVENGHIRGLPLGNLTSQLFANILMNKVDQYIKNILRVKYYLRYADDLFIIVDGKSQAKEVYSQVKEFIENNLRLICNPVKSGIYPLHRGIDGLGFNTSGELPLS